MTKNSAALVFGASGSIGRACLEAMSELCPTYALSHTDSNFNIGAPYSSVIWAQGKNQTKSFLDTSDADWQELMEANFHFVRKTVKALLEQRLVQRPSSFVFIGSIWADIAKVDKSAYIVTKSALQGLTRSLALELAPLGVRVNSVSPGIVENSMTLANLSPEQLGRVKTETPGQHLVRNENIAKIVRFMASEESIGINGQSITVDHGWSIAKYI